MKKLQKDRQLLSRLEKILENIANDPFSPEFKFERLKHNLSGYCSKRLDKKNRIIYQVYETEILVLIVSVVGHYE